MVSSEIIAAALGILIFFGGAAWLEIHSRKNRQAVRQGEHSSRPDVSTVSAEVTVQSRAGEGG